MGDAHADAAGAVRNSERKGAPQRLRARGARSREFHSQARFRRRGAWHRRVRAGCAARGAALFRIQDHGRHRGADAPGGVGRRMADTTRRTSSALGALGVCRVDFCRLGRDAGGVAGDRDRAPTLARHRRAAHGRCGWSGPGSEPRIEPDKLHPDLHPDADFVHRRANAPGGQRCRGETVTLDLPLVFAGIMGLAMLLYVVLDGYDLGVGMLVPAATPEQQNLMVNSIGPFWDANETWLVLGIGVLLVAFPAAHGLVLTALYLPVVVMLIGLMLRGAAFEFRIKALGWHRELWNWLFWLGSFLASFAQGFMLGRYITGFESGFGFFLFAAVVGAGLCGGYVLLGATWLILRTEGELQQKSIVWARWGLAWTFLGIGLVSLGTPLVAESVREKWFGSPLVFVLMLLPVATLASGIALWRSCGKLARGEKASELATSG